MVENIRTRGQDVRVLWQNLRGKGERWKAIKYSTWNNGENLGLWTLASLQHTRDWIKLGLSSSVSASAQACFCPRLLLFAPWGRGKIQNSHQNLPGPCGPSSIPLWQATMSPSGYSSRVLGYQRRSLFCQVAGSGLYCQKLIKFPHFLLPFLQFQAEGKGGFPSWRSALPINPLVTPALGF